ncbi:MAG: YbaB/EbfC family nucleoid-associated protein [Planctomycetota bacterium]
MFGSLGNITGLLKSAKDLQSNLAKVQQEMLTRRYDAESGAGAVKVTVDGRGTLVDIRIQPSAASDVELLEDLIKAAVGAATTKSQEGMKNDMLSVTGGINVPGLQDLLGGAK